MPLPQKSFPRLHPAPPPQDHQEHPASNPILSLFHPSNPPPTHRRRAYQAFDINGDGHIDATELKAVLDNLGERISADALDKMIDEVRTVSLRR